MSIGTTASHDLAFSSVGSLALSGAEISAYDAASKRLFVTSNAGLQIVDLSNPAAPSLISTIPIATLSASGGDISSVAVKNGVVAVAIPDQTKSNAGKVVLLDAATGNILKSLTVGALPDMVTFTPDGLKVLVANEAEVVSDGNFGGNGSVSIIDLAGGAASATVQTADFTSFNGQEDALRAQGVRIWAGKTVAEDVEPEYIAVSPDGTKAMVTLQEANAVAILDIATATFTSIVPLGTKDFSGLAFDPSDRDGPGSTTKINPVTGLPVKGLYMPDAISSYSSGGKTYFVTANEGDDRDDFLSSDETIRVNNVDYDLDDTLFPNEAALKSDAQLGRLTVSNAPGLRGDTDGDGDIDEILMYGGRSFTILDSDGNLVFDSGDAIERIVATEFPNLFDDTRSDNKGPEPEGVTVATIGGRNYAFVGLERSHLTLTFDVTDPTHVTYTGGLRHDGDLNPEGGLFIPAAESPTGKMLFVSSNEVSTNISVFEVEQPFKLQILHYYGESGLLGVETAPIMGALIDRFDDQYANTLVLGEGDSYIPGPWLVGGADPSLSLIPGIGATALGRPDIAIMNAFGTDASALGNHEFDLGSPVLQGALNASGAWAGALFPLITTNLDFSADGALSGLADKTLGGNAANSFAGMEASAIKGKIAPYTIVSMNGEKVGIVGSTTFELLTKTSPNGTKPTDDNPLAVDANDLQEVAAKIQAAVDSLTAMGINKIIEIDQLDDIERTRDVASLVSGVDVWVTGGGHERLADDNDTLAGFNGHDATPYPDASYPIATTGLDGQTSLIVTTDTEYSYLGRLVVEFDASGHVVLGSLDSAINGAYASTEATLQAAYGTTQTADEIIASSTIGSKVEAIVDGIDSVVKAKDGTVYGYTNVYLEGDRVFGRAQEVNLGDITADANLWKGQQASGAAYMVSLKNGGGLRASIGSIDEDGGKIAPIANPGAGKLAGGISQLDIENALRFDNRLMVFDTTAQGLKNILEYGVTLPAGNGGYAQLGGVRVAFDPTKPAGQRVTDIALVDLDGNMLARVWQNGSVATGAPGTISVTALNFTANGGDGYPIKPNGTNFRYLLADGTLSAAVDPALDFTAAATMAAVGQTPATVLGEQKAFGDFLQARHGTPDTAYDKADTPAVRDERIENLGVRGNVVFGRMENGTPDSDRFVGTDTNDTLHGGARGDFLRGAGADDTLTGDDGNDQIDGGKGWDMLAGGAGNDTLKIRSGDVEAGELYDGGTGLDTILLGKRGAVDLSSAYLVGVERVQGSAGRDEITLSAGQFLSLDSINGGDGDDTVKVTLAGSVDISASQRPKIASVEALTVAGSAGADNLTLTAEQFMRFSAVDLSSGVDTVTVVVTGKIDFTSGLPALNGVQVVKLVGAGSVRLNVAQLGVFKSIAPGLDATLADTGANLATLKPAAFGELAARGIDRIDATDNLLTLRTAQLQALGAVALTAADQVVLHDTGARIELLKPARIAQMAAMGVDAIDASNDKLALELAQFEALDKIALTAADALTLTGTRGDDVFSFVQQRLGAEDRIDARAGNDRLVLSGDYSAGLVFQSATMTNMELLKLGEGFDYELTLADANVGAGEVLAVSAKSLGAMDSVLFDGSKEKDGSFSFSGGAGSSIFIGGRQADSIKAGLGIDTFAYTAAGQSTSDSYDTITDADFAHDFFDVGGSVTSVATVNSGALSTTNFDSDLAVAMNGVLAARTAALFTPTTSDLHGATFLVVDQNAKAGYQAGNDLVVRLNNATGALETGNFA
ncbi:MAG: choice-of-anchor I family protein [Enhydrobacter sp.]|nr:choice-of-anchor I family protein [Enhydrobacter sp.]